MLFITVVATLWWGVSSTVNVCPNYGDMPLSNEGVNNYVIGLLEVVSDYFIPFPYAIDKCTSHSLIATGMYYTHVCNNGVIATQAFKDTNCTMPKGLPTMSSSADKYGAGEVGYFECDGENTYAELYVAANATTGDRACGNLQHLYIGLNGCVDEPEFLGQALSVYCDPTRTIIEWFMESPQPTGISGTTEHPETTGIPQFSSTSSTQGPPGLNVSHIPTSSMLPLSSSMFPSTSQEPTKMCDADNYCFNWHVQRVNPCQRIANLQGTNIALWAKMGTCHYYTSAAVRSDLGLLTAMLVAIIATLAY